MTWAGMESTWSGLVATVECHTLWAVIGCGAAKVPRGCNEIFMQSQRVLAAEDAKDAELMPRSRPASGL